QTLIAAARLRELGHTVALYDVTLAQDPEVEFTEALDTHRPRVLVAIEDNFNFLTKMCLTRNRELSFKMAKEVARRGIAAVVNGSDSSDRARAYLDAGFDAVVLGEPESALEEIADGTARGVIQRKAPVRELDTLPDPAWDLIDFATYRSAWKRAHGYFSLNL